MATAQHLPSALDSLPNVPQTLSEREALARLLPSQTLTLAADLLAQFPHCKAEDGFTRAMAELFNSYPASVVRGITNARNGLAAQAEFLSLAAISKWLAQNSETIFEAADRDRRRARQVSYRADEPPSQSLLKKMHDWITRADPKAKELSRDDDTESRRAQITIKRMSETNETRAAEYRAHGLDPVYADEDHAVVVSLPMMLHMGWQIGEIDGHPALTRGGVA